MPTPIEYTLMDINTKDILVDPDGQRDVNRRTAQFRKIMRTFDPNLVQPLSVAKTDGKYWCFDGQMTMKVLKARNKGRDLCVKCRVYEGMTKYEAAQMFRKQRGTVAPVSKVDDLYVAYKQGDPQAVALVTLTEINGLEIAWNKVSGKNAITAVSTLEQEFNLMNDHELFASFIRVLKEAWDGDPAGSQAKILKGLGMFMRSYKGRYKEERLAAQLSTKRPVDLIRDAEADRTSGARKYAVQILLAYNYRLQGDSRLPNIL